MPFYVPWTDALAGRARAQHGGLPLALARRVLAERRAGLDLAVIHDGQLVGVQGFETSDYLVTRTGETGSWLGPRVPGARARHGDAAGDLRVRSSTTSTVAEVTSGAFLDNPASLAVSRKVGYRPNGDERRQAPCGRAGAQPVPGPDDRATSCAARDPVGRAKACAPFRSSVGLDCEARIGRAAANVWQNRPLSPACPDPLIRSTQCPSSDLTGPHLVEGHSPTTIPEETPQTWPSRFV